MTKEANETAALIRSLTALDVPEHDHGGLIRYVLYGIEPGGFLTAVISNDLKEAFNRADSINQRHMFNIVNWLYNHAPMACWGSPAKMSAWIISKRGIDGVKLEEVADDQEQQAGESAG